MLKAHCKGKANSDFEGWLLWTVNPNNSLKRATLEKFHINAHKIIKIIFLGDYFLKTKKSTPYGLRGYKKFLK